MAMYRGSKPSDLKTGEDLEQSLKNIREQIEQDLYEVDQRQSLQNLKDIPNPKLHQTISFIKSGIRLVSCFIGIIGFYELGFFGLLLAEIVGIYEELV
tara:strand:- start:361 stop:654 length:294 start_codon:yes stop_codon:yes gene_type:complete